VALELVLWHLISALTGSSEGHPADGPAPSDGPTAEPRERRRAGRGSRPVAALAGWASGRACARAARSGAVAWSAGCSGREQHSRPWRAPTLGASCRRRWSRRC
jgi:hypothetical protein